MSGCTRNCPTNPLGHNCKKRLYNRKFRLSEAFQVPGNEVKVNAMQKTAIQRSRRWFVSRVVAGAAAGGLLPRTLTAGEAVMQRSDRCQSVLDRLKGPMASITIPYNKDYSIDHGSLRAWVDFMCEKKAPILFMTYGDSELGLLTEQEIEAVIRTVTKQAQGRSLVLGGTGVWWTGRTIDFINRVEDSGVDAINVHIGKLVRKDDDIYEAFRQIDERTEVPFLSSSDTYSVDLMKRLASLPKMIGDKCHEELFNYHAYIRATKKYNFAILSGGQMKHFLFGYLVGSAAYLCPITPIAPQIGIGFYDALKRGDMDQSREIVYKYEDGLLQITIKLGYPHCYKSLLYLARLYKTTLVRPPRRSNRPEDLGPLKEFLQEHGWIPI